MRLNLSRAEKINRLRTLPNELERALAGLDESALDPPYREGGWTVRQVAHHIADLHLNAYIRVKLLLTEGDPPLKPYDENAWAALPDGRSFPVASALVLVRSLHERFAAAFENADADAWARTARHPENGTMTLDDLLDSYAWHGRHHVEQITGLRERRHW